MTPALPPGRKIVLLGADDRGKAALAEALSQRLEQHGIAATLVAEPLPERPLDALAAHRGALILLLASASPTPADDLLRATLMQAKLSFAVVHGEGADRLANAWNAIGATADPDGRSRALAEASARWSWACDKCSDPACEHRLFTELVAQRG